MISQSVKVRLLPEAGAESFQRLCSIVLAPIEAPIHESLHPLKQLVEQGGDDERGDYNSQLRLASCERSEDVLQRDNAAEVDQHQRRRQSTVDQGAVDDYIDVVETVAEHRNPYRRGLCEDHQTED